jgi:glucose-1-phosphatase
MGDLVLGDKCFKNVKNIVFDLGGVVINIDYQLTVQKFKEAGIIDFDKIYGQYSQTELFDKFDKGFASPDEFRKGLQKLAKTDLSDAIFNNAWNTMIGHLPEENLNLLLKLKKQYKTFLLSNTNEIHLDFFFKYLKDTYGINNFNDYFDNVHYSCRMGMRKPDLEIYNKVIEVNKLNPTETLFIDDTTINVDTAIKAGWQGYYMPKGKLMSDLFNEMD